MLDRRIEFGNIRGACRWGLPLVAVALALGVVPAIASDYYLVPQSNVQYHPNAAGVIACHDNRVVGLLGRQMAADHTTWLDLQKQAESRSSGYFKIWLRQNGCVIVGGDTKWQLIWSDGDTARMAEYHPETEAGDAIYGLYFRPSDLHGPDGRNVPYAAPRTFLDGKEGSSLFGVGGNDFHTGSLRSSFPAMR